MQEEPWEADRINSIHSPCRSTSPLEYTTCPAAAAFYHLEIRQKGGIEMLGRFAQGRAIE